MTSHSGSTPWTLVVIGTGPRGISVLERLAARLAAGRSDRPVRIYAIDDVEVGAGRIWRTDQDDWYTMNTVAGQITMYSGSPDAGPWRPGAGPSLDEWSRRHPGEKPLGPDGYASRRTYGRYLRSVHRSIVDHLPEHVELVGIRARVSSLAARPVGGWLVELDEAPHLLAADQVLLATGHPTNTPDAFEQRMLDFAERHGGTHYLCGDSAADLDLGTGTIPPGTTVGIRGLGLSFYDVMLALTVGRGGIFKRTAEGPPAYLASGQEPRIVAGSRSGLPIPARGVNQKAPDHAYRPRFLTKEAVESARRKRQEATGNDQLSFAEDVLPLLMGELNHVYEEVQALHGDGSTLPPLDLDRLARPFAGRTFATPQVFTDHLLHLMRADLADAELGNANGPLKAALDVLRDIRNVVREAVDYGGLLPRSHEEEFAGAFLPVNALLSAGPPAERVEQLVALIEAGVVEIAGPATEFTADESTGLFRITSPQVGGSGRYAEVLIDARIPTPDLHRDTSELTMSLLADGVISEYVRTGPGDSQPVGTGGLHVTRAPFHVIGADGKAHEDLYALGIPTEHTRWFTQVGSGKPGLNTLFRQDADAIAEAMLRPLEDDADAVPACAGRVV
ncbi:FAD/NAD(P)-binding protein [Kitasatospora aureofaciens]|uniref:FAD/NAD(P)-binding protein n=1 Tax=Kitasatospora aureofaciens TaxID=1894 RepID=UPI001C491B85|nr:FAD/NAD(P)-binding protein [Kitasatospora aureofaciens]MBV6699929.1 FAD/NAD(P)-binding protein [Kitasatospora aureofaciens]